MISLSSLRQRLALFIHRSRAAADVRRELSVMTDAELNDLGISRTAIARLAREAAQGLTPATPR